MLLVLDGKTNNIMLELSCFHNSCSHVFHSINGLSIPVGVSLKASAYKCIKANCSSSVFFFAMALPYVRSVFAKQK